MMPSRTLPALLVGALLSLAVGGASAQEETGALMVSVTALATGEPVEGARVAVVGAGISATTNSAGVLRLAGVPLGVQTVEVRRLGYSTRLRLVGVEAGRAARAAFALEVEAIPVAEIRVRAPVHRRPDYLELAGFHRRKATGSGFYITRAEIEAQNPLYLSEVLRRFPGIVILPYAGQPGGYATFARSGGHRCPIQYFVDGVLTGPGFNVDDVRAGDVEGMEVYRGVSQVPPEFNRQTAMCGVIAIWTRVE